jgi:hypothetical protein
MFLVRIALLQTVLQLAVTPEHIAIATALGLMSRSVGGAVGTAIANAVYNSKIAAALPDYITRAAVMAGLPDTEASLKPFVQGISSHDLAMAGMAPGATAEIVEAGRHAALQAYAHS